MSARTRRSLVLLWTALFVCSLALQYANFFVVPSPVEAVHATDTFELDGNVANDGVADDWADIKSGPNSAFESLFMTDAINGVAAERLFTGGDSKDIDDIPAWRWTTGPGVQDKNDLENVFAAAYIVDGDLVVYFGADRYASNGDAQVGFWFLQSGVSLNTDGTFLGEHVVGDVLVQIDFENGGTDPILRAYEWVGSGGDTSGTLDLVASGGSCATAPSGDLRCAIANTSVINPPYAFDEKFEGNETDDSYKAGTFVEGGINLTDLGLAEGCFTTFIAETRSSQEPTATLSDFALGGFDLCGQVTIIKDAVPNDAQDFAFSGDLGAFDLDDDANATLSNTKTFTNVNPGTYTVTEAAVTGWDLTALVCVEQDGTSNSSVDLETRTATLRVEPKEDVTCTFTNTKRGTIIVEKQTNPDGAAGNFTFTGDAAGTIADNGTITVSNLVPGTYTSTEADPTPPFDLGSIVCNDANSTGDVSTRTATFRLEAGETVKCTFTNEKRGQIIIDKVTNPSGDTASFEFDPSYGSNFNLTDTTNPNNSGLLQPGQYTVAELAKTGWDLTGLSCDDANSTENVATRTATVNLEAGETVTCTFTNTKRGTIIVEKQTSPDGADGTFTFTGDAAGTIGDGDTITVTNLVPGQYTSTESDPGANWDLGAIVCNDNNSTGNVGTATATFNLDPGETVKCTFTNVQRGTITIIKDADPNSAQDFHFTTTGSGLSAFDLDDDNNATLSNIQTFENVAAGSYSVTEVAVAGWDLTDLDCVGQDGASGTPDGATADITMTAGGSVTCTFTNTERGSITIVKDARPNDGHDFEFTIERGDWSETFLLDDDGSDTLPSSRTFENLVPGTYDVTEDDSEGWDLTDLVCNDTDQGTTIEGATASIDLDPGQHITCTFVNSEPDIEIIKTAEDAEDGEVYVTEAFHNNVTYFYDVTNTGEVDLFDVTVWDDNGTPDDDSDDILVCEIDELKVDESVTCDETLTVLEDTTNVAIASGESEAGTEVDDDDDAEVDVVAPEIEIVKTAGDAEDGEVYVTSAFPNNVTYHYEITNTGDVDLLDVEVVDDNGTPANTADDIDVCAIEELPVGETETCEVTLTVSETTTNVAVATGHTEQQPDEDVSDDDDAVVRVPLLTIDKSFVGNTGGEAPDGTPEAKEGDVLTYTLAYDLTNGPVHNGVITDTLPVGLAYVAGSATNNSEFTFDSFNEATRTLTWKASTVTEDGTVTYKAEVLEDSAELPQPLVNVATIDSDETDKDDDDEKVAVEPTPLAETATPVITLPPTNTLEDGAGQSNPGYSLMLVLLVLGGLVLAVGVLTPTPARVRRQGRRG